MSSRWLLLLPVVIGLSGCAGPGTDLEGRTVSNVKISQKGPATADPARLNAFIGTTVGSPYKSDRIDEDIKALYESGMVNDARVLAEAKGGGVELTYEVEARAPMGPGPGFVGNAAFSNERLAKETGLRVGQEIDLAALAAAAKRIESYYHSRGYIEAEVSIRSEPAMGRSPDLSFVIEEGKKRTPR